MRKASDVARPKIFKREASLNMHTIWKCLSQRGASSGNASLIINFSNLQISAQTAVYELAYAI